MDKHAVAEVLEEIALLLELQGENPFKVRAYHNAVRSLEGLEGDFEKLVEEGELESLPGIGAHIAEKITTLVRTGRLPYYEKLKKSVPEGLVALMGVPGLGGKKIKALHEKLKIKSKADLIQACKLGKVAKLRGFGSKTQQNILEGITKQETYAKRTLWWNAVEIAQPILEQLLKLKEVKKAEIAGSIRRKLETVGDLDFVVASAKPAAVIDWFTKQSWVAKVQATGSTKASVRLEQGIQADLRVVSEEEYPFALLYFTGSKQHSIELRKRANTLHLSLSEYGFEPALKKKLASEEAIYLALKLSYIPPELREDMGEIEAAAKKKIPTLVEAEDIRGVFHCHTTDSDGHNTLEEMVAAAEDLEWEYLGIADHSKSSFQANGMDEERLFAQIKRIRKLNQAKKFSTHVFAGLECDILTDGSLDFSNDVLKELDYVVASIHRSFQLEEKKMTARLIKAIENPYTTMVGHVTGRLLLKREGYAVNLQKVIDACIANGKIMELNAHPMRLDMDWRLWHKAAEKGLKCSINPDAHSVGDLMYYLAGVNSARKGWLEKRHVINTLPLKKIQSLIEPQ